MTSAAQLRQHAAVAERRGDWWQREANSAFGRGHARMGQAYADQAAWFYRRVSRLGEEAAELERIAKRWPEETLNQPMGGR